MTYEINTRQEFGDLLRTKIYSRWGNIEKSTQPLAENGLKVDTLRIYIGGRGFPAKRKNLQMICETLGIDIDSLNLVTLVNPTYYREFGIDPAEFVSGNITATNDTLDAPFPERIEYNIGNEGSQGVIVGRSDAMKRVFNLLYTINTNPNQEVSVLITGETGTGKELVAKAVHYNSPRAEKKYVPLNITTVGDTLLESQLFGYKKGAFTDAREDREGFLGAVGDGTLFLDEVSSLSSLAQAKLLRVLENKSFYRIGDTTISTFNGRVVAATKEDMEKLVQEKKLRDDLYFRLDQVRIQLPPLRERGEDSFLLFQHFVYQYNQQFRKNYNLEPSPSAREAMASYPFPGNVRELKNMIIKAIFNSSDNLTVKIEEIIEEKRRRI